MHLVYTFCLTKKMKIELPQLAKLSYRPRSAGAPRQDGTRQIKKFKPVYSHVKRFTHTDFRFTTTARNDFDTSSVIVVDDDSDSI